MNKLIGLSVVISAYNEEGKIEECLQAVSFADEIILVDNSSSDSTATVARRYTPHIFKRPNNPMLNINKNFGFTKATHEWILNLDADERVTQGLKDEIITLLKNEPKAVGYWIPRKNIIFGKWIQHTGWYPDYQLRLFRKNKGSFEEKHVHEKIKVSGVSDYLAQPLLHLNYETILQFLYKHINLYSENEAAQLIKNGYIFNYLDAIRFPAKEFILRFFAQKGYKDGAHGLVLSCLMAFYHLIILSRIWEKEDFKQTNRDVLAESEKEFKKIQKEFTYWFLTEKIDTLSHPLPKLLARVKRKIAA